MYIQQLQISDFRNIGSVELSPVKGFNQITGTNGAGKTSILEAIYLLSSGHTFRTRKARELIKRDRDGFSVIAKFVGDDTASGHQAGIARNRDGTTQLKLDYQNQHSIAEFSRLLPVKAISPDSHKLVQEGPDLRRQYLDWGVFHVEQSFLEIWKNYRRTLLQRNNCLKSLRPQKEVSAWDEELVLHGEKLTALRSHYVDLLIPEIKRFCNAFGLSKAVETRFRNGWPTDSTFIEALKRESEQSSRSLFTTVGPHRAELAFRTEGLPARQILSRGEQKMLVYALHFAQLALFAKTSGQAPIMLCDDLSAELDKSHQGLILNALSELSIQTFISGNSAVKPPLNSEQKVFHVEHGTIVKVL